MAQPHVIRLRGPWELEPLERDRPDGERAGQPDMTPDALPAGCRVQVPGDWREALGADFCGRVRYGRRFNCPTNLAADERVWLVLEGVDYQAQVSLNGHAVGGPITIPSAARLDITSLLAPHNALVVEVSLPAAVFADPHLRPGRASQPGGMIGEVRLEIGPDLASPH